MTSPTSGQARRRQWPMLALPFALSLALNLPALTATFVPTVDTFESFSGFGVFVKHVRQYGELPLWLPYSSYGAPADWRQLQLISPCGWVFVLVGALFRGADLLLLFKLSVILEQALFGLSCAWLAGVLFRQTSVRAFFVVAAVMASGPWKQITFNLRLATPVPWMIGLLVLAFRRKSRALLIASLLPIPIVAYGCSFYTLAYLSALWSAALVAQILICRPSGLSWLVAPPGRGRALREAAALAGLALLAAAVAGQLLLVKSGQSVSSPARDPVTGLVSPAVYLAYGGVTNLTTLIGSAAVALPDFAHNGEAYLYVGATVFSLAVLGVSVARARAARLATWLLLFAAAFAVAGVLTLALYRFPLMSNFRHVAYTAIVARFFLCLVGAFGAQALLDVAARPGLASSRRSGRVPLVVALVLLFAVPLPAIWSPTAASGGGIQLDPALGFFVFSSATGLVGALGVWAALRFLRPPRAAAATAAIVLGALAIGAAALTARIYARESHQVPSLLAGAVRTAVNAPIFYVPVRGVADPQVEEFLGRLSSGGTQTRYDTTDTLLSRDVPATGERAHVVPERTLRLLQLQRQDPGAYRSFAMHGQPKAFLVEAPEEVAGGDGRLEPGKVLVEFGDRTLAARRSDAAGVEVREFSFNRVRFGLPAAAGPSGLSPRRFLVYLDAWHPEWTATVLGRPAAVWPANRAFKAVEVPPGAVEVELRFGSRQRWALALLNAFAASAAIVLEIAALYFLGGVSGRPRDGVAG